MLEIEADDAGWKLEKIIATGPSNNNATKHVFLDKWEGYSHGENTWETSVNVNENARELLEEYYVQNASMEKDKGFGKGNIGKKDAGSAEKRKSQKRKKSQVFTLLFD